MFFPWLGLMPAAVDLCPIQLPGREMRLRETPYTCLESLVDDLVGVLVPYLSIPYAFFGHSMGALISFELARRLRKEGIHEPELLFVSAFSAPDVPNPNPPIHDLPDSEFIDCVQRLYQGIPDEVLREREFLNLILPALRSDFTLMELYSYRPEPPLNVSIVCFGGDRDGQVDAEGLWAWRRHTWGDFALDLLPGDHFFLKSARGRLVHALIQWMDPFVR